MRNRSPVGVLPLGPGSFLVGPLDGGRSPHVGFDVQLACAELMPHAPSYKGIDPLKVAAARAGHYAIKVYLGASALRYLLSAHRLTRDHNDCRAGTPSLATIAVRECTIEIHGIAFGQQRVLAVNVHGKLTTDHIDDLCA